MTEEVAIAHQPGHRSHAESRGAVQRDVHVGELRDPRPIELELPGTAEIRAAGVAVVKRAQVPPDRAPDLLLLVGIVDPRHRLAVAVLERDARDGVAPGAIDGIAEAGMVGIELHQPRRVEAVRRLQLQLFGSRLVCPHDRGVEV